jgi:pilus assembly protein CpaC
MFQSRSAGMHTTVSITLAMIITLWCGTTWAASSAVAPTIESGNLQLTVGKSIILKSTRPVKRVSLANPEIADFILLSPREIYITGKSLGVTNLTLWQNQTVTAIYDLEVTTDISRLKQKLNAVLPGERDLRVLATQDSITLAGRISSSANLSQALSLAEAYAPKGKVRNLLEVGGVHQVMLEVRVAEMQRSLVRQMGVNIGYNRGGDFALTSLGDLTRVVAPSDANLLNGALNFDPAKAAFGPLGIFAAPAVNALFRFQHGSATWTGFVDALKEEGLIKVLAEPTLIALSGQTASFLAGGEFPIPVPQGLGTVAIEYKSFGVALAFTPTVWSSDKISIKVAPEVSELDFTTAVQIGGFVIPGLSTRRAATTVELKDGQSFALAGLLRDTVRDTASKYPLLGDIPIIGTLFRSRAFQKNQTELVIIATPHLVKPLDMAGQPLPTDFYIEPNDTELYLLGLMEGSEKRRHTTLKGDLDGDFGHSMPIPE